MSHPSVIRWNHRGKLEFEDCPCTECAKPLRHPVLTGLVVALMLAGAALLLAYS